VYPALNPHLPFGETASALTDKRCEKPLDGGVDGTPSTSKDVAKNRVMEKKNWNNILKMGINNRAPT
jgi:hypothetical protein